MRAILYKDGVKVKTDEYPNKDMEPLVGLESGYEWQLIEVQPYPEYDRKTQKLVQVETKTNTPNLDYPHLNNTIVSFEVVNLFDDEIIELERNEQKVKINSIVSNNELKTDIVKIVGIILRELKLKDLPIEEMNLIEKIGFVFEDIKSKEKIVKDKEIELSTNPKNPLI